ncbi:MAG TPA: amidohydrolase family protein, partial [Mycobacterium sp.]
FTSTPENELGQGHCTDVTRQLLRIGSAPSLGTDTEIVTPGEILVAARMTLAVQRGLVHAQAFEHTGLGADTMPITAKQALSWATTEGARALGLADRIGRIEPGMQADLAVIDARAINLWPPHDPAAAALHAHVGNIESVMIAGTWRKRDHALVETGVEEVMGRLQESGERIVRHVRAPGPIGRVRGGVVKRVVRRQLRHQADQGGSPSR